MTSRLVSAALLVCVCLACRPGSQESGTVVRDSAGIRIVENHDPSWEEGHAWAVDSEPALDIGAVESDADYRLFRVADAVRLSDGRVVVVNAGSGELRCFTGNGTFVWSAGRAGEGPGEFRDPVWLQRANGDSVAAYDFRLRRISIVDGNGAFVSSYQIPPELEGERVTAVGLFGDGSVLLQSFGSPPQQGKYRDTLAYYRFVEDHGIVARLGRFPGWEKFFWSQGNTRGLADHPFGLGAFPVAHESRFVLGINDEYGFAEYTQDGLPIQLIRREHTKLQVTSRDVDRYREQRLAVAQAFWQGLFPHITFPQTMPAYRRLLVDGDGAFWVEEYRRPDDEVPRWTVFAPDGRLLGTVTLPVGLRVFEIGWDYVLGVWADDLDVEHVRLHAVRGRTR